MSTEEQLRDALRIEAERFQAPTGLWPRVADGMDRRSEGGGRRAAWIAIALGLVLIAGAIIAVAARDRGDGDDAATPTSGPPTAGATTTAPAQGDERPGRIVASERDGDIVVLDASEGTPLLVLFDHTTCPSCGPPTALNLAPGGATLFFQQTEGGVGRIKRVAVAGGPVTTVGDGCVPAPSPDGRRLAFVACGRGEDLVVRDLADGSDRRLPRGAGRSALTTQGLAWSADGSSLYFSAGGPSPSELWQLDLATARAQTDARRLGPPSRLPEGTGWSNPRRHESKLAVIESCCGSGDNAFSGGASLVVLDLAANREIERTELDEDVHPVSVAFDDTGSHTLLVTDDGDLYRAAGDSELERVGGGFLDAVWT